MKKAMYWMTAMVAVMAAGTLHAGPACCGARAPKAAVAQKEEAKTCGDKADVKSATACTQASKDKACCLKTDAKCVEACKQKAKLQGGCTAKAGCAVKPEGAAKAGCAAKAEGAEKAGCAVKVEVETKTVEVVE